MTPRYASIGRLVGPALLALSLASPVAAQLHEIQITEFRKCAIMELYPELLPGNYSPGAKALERDRAAVRRQFEGFRAGPGEVYRIPVVIHIVHHFTDAAPGMGSNITNAQALSQIEILNQDFRAILGTPGESSYPDSIAADVRVEFVLATEDPEGNPTTGIVRHARADYVPGVGYDPALGYPGQFDLVVKPETIWDPERYMNMWSADLGPLLLGYAQFPEGSGLAGMPTDPQEPNTDGVVVNYSAFGSSDVAPGGNYNPPYDKGRTATHEVGHYLGLRHIWGDGACPVDDFVLDTPRAADSNAGCPNANSCDDTQYGVSTNPRDMVENYMDYTDDLCMDTFTEGQKARIRHVLEVSPRRASLVGNQPGRRGLVVAKGDGDVPVHDGEILTYTVTVTNDADDPAAGVVLTDEVPEGTVYVAGSASNGGTQAGGVVTWNSGTMAPDQTITRTFQVRVATEEGSEFVFQDGIEDGTDNWTIGGLLPTWAVTDTDPHRGASSWFAEDPDGPSDQWLTLDASAPLPEDALFRFWHHYNTEATFDGGVVELSTNGGLTWEDLGPYMTQNGYNGTIPLENNPLIDGPAFDGDSEGYLETIADLGAFAGQPVTIRFRLSSDAATPAEGWYVDDVAFATRLVSVTGTARAVSAGGEEGTATLTTDVLPALPTALTVALVPEDEPVVVGAEGGPVTFTVTLTNPSSEARTFEAWSEAMLPSGALYGPLVGPVAVRLGPGATVTRTLTQRVPANAPPGTYTYTANVGAYPSAIEASDGFPITKEGAALRPEAIAAFNDSVPGWDVAYAESGVLVAAGDRWTAGVHEAPALTASGLPEAFSLLPASPNPSAAAFVVPLALPEPAAVRVEAFDLLGRRVATLADGRMEAGTHPFVLDGARLAAGVYVVRAAVAPERGASRTFAQRVTLLR